jgi:hypothetical protein
MHADLTVITLEEHYGDSELANCIARSGTCLSQGRALGPARPQRSAAAYDG